VRARRTKEAIQGRAAKVSSRIEDEVMAEYEAEQAVKQEEWATGRRMPMTFRDPSLAPLPLTSSSGRCCPHSLLRCPISCLRRGISPLGRRETQGLSRQSRRLRWLRQMLLTGRLLISIGMTTTSVIGAIRRGPRGAPE
jgi:hypothetical protein